MTDLFQFRFIILSLLLCWPLTCPFTNRWLPDLATRSSAVADWSGDVCINTADNYCHHSLGERALVIPNIDCDEIKPFRWRAECQYREIYCDLEITPNYLSKFKYDTTALFHAVTTSYSRHDSNDSADRVRYYIVRPYDREGSVN